MEMDYDVVVIGSGFGGSVSALRLAEKGYRVLVVERGKRYRPQDFAKTNWDIRRFMWLPRLKCFGIQNLSLFKNVLILSGAGVGGGSLVYANTLIEPGDLFYNYPGWKDLKDWRAELKNHYASAKRMLGVTPNPQLTYVDEQIRTVAREMGREQTFTPVPVGVFFGNGKGNGGAAVPDPYFGGEGPERVPCNFCGSCMVGCRHGSKNTLDKNYLYLAEKKGAQIRAETSVTHVAALGKGDGSDGYELSLERSTAWFLKNPTRIRARSVVFAGGVLGTVSLLFSCREKGGLPRISQALGRNVRTNSEALLGLTTRGKDKDLSKGIAITSGFYPDDVTHVEPCRYPSGSSFMKFLAAPMADDGSRITRPLKMLLATILHPIDTLTLWINSRWAESTVILLVMQTLDNKMKFSFGRGFLTLFRKGLRSSPEDGSKVPSYIPIAHVVARKLAERMNAIPQSAINEVMLQIPTTAHILGGCGIASTPEQGVIDTSHRVFGYENLYVCDGSVIPANLGVNPSLTITALTERCMSLLPPKGGA